MASAMKKFLLQEPSVLVYDFLGFPRDPCLGSFKVDLAFIGYHTSLYDCVYNSLTENQIVIFPKGKVT